MASTDQPRAIHGPYGANGSVASMPANVATLARRGAADSRPSVWTHVAPRVGSTHRGWLHTLPRRSGSDPRRLGARPGFAGRTRSVSPRPGVHLRLGAL